MPAFPFDVLPAPVADLCQAVAESVYCPPDYPAVAALAAASAAIGASFTVEVKPDFRQSAALFLCVVGDPSVKKSPPLKHVLRPIITEQSARVERIREKWPEGNLPDQWAEGEGELFCSDVTAESLAELLQRQPRGLLLYRPELVGWLMSMNQYKAKGVGGDRSFFLEVYDSDPITIHRKTGTPKSIHVSRPTLAMVGATQPDVVREFFTRRDGLAERILFTFPARLPARGERWYEVPGRLFAEWGRALRFLWELQMRHPTGGGRPYPNTVRLTDDARPAWQAFTDELARRQNDPDCPAPLRPALGKLEGSAARLALVIQLLGAAGGAPDGDDGITARSVEAAGKLALYFGDHAARVQRACGADERLEGARRILGWAAGQPADAGGRTRFSRADLWRALRRNTLFPRPEALGAPLDLLAAHHAVRRVEAIEEVTGGGRPPLPTYELNPAARAGISGRNAPNGYSAESRNGTGEDFDEPIRCIPST